MAATPAVTKKGARKTKKSGPFTSGERKVIQRAQKGAHFTKRALAMYDSILRHVIDIVGRRASQFMAHAGRSTLQYDDVIAACDLELPAAINTQVLALTRDAVAKLKAHDQERAAGKAGAA